jgi:NADH-quinone oxidoreductase subunit M
MVLGLFGMRRTKTIAWFAFIVTIIDFVASLLLLPNFDKEKHVIQFVEKVPWIESLGVQYYFGVDGISILLVLLTTFLGMWAVLSSFTAIQERVKEYYVFMLLLQTGMLGVFFSLDLFLFYVFWEVMLVPMYFLIGVWGGARKLYAAIKFFLYTLAGSVLMLLAILTLVILHHKATGEVSFEIFKLYGLDLPMSIEKWLFLAFFVGFAIKVPMFPFHTWLPDAHVEAPTAGSVILAGVLLKMGTYGFVRFSLPLFPEALSAFLPWMILLSVFGIVYGALTAMMQPDMKKLVAYSSVSHLGFVMLGVFALNPEGVQGGILQMINHGLSTGGLFLLVGLIYERRHTRMIAEFGGLSKRMPIYAALFMIITLSSIGLPVLNGFIGEFTILIGAFKSLWMNQVAGLAVPHPEMNPFMQILSVGLALPVAKIMMLLATSGIVLGAAYMLWLYQRVMFGKLENPKNEDLEDLNFREIMTLVPIVIMCFWIGIYPTTWTSYMDAAVEATVEAANDTQAHRDMMRMEESGMFDMQQLPAGHPPIADPHATGVHGAEGSAGKDVAGHGSPHSALPGHSGGH